MTVLISPSSLLPSAASESLPTLIRDEGERAERRYWEFFTATIRNRNTRFAYALAIRQFLDWCHGQGFRLSTIEPITVATYVELLLAQGRSSPTVKQHLAAIRVFFDWFVIGQVAPFNPASSVRGPKHVVKRGRTPVLTAEQARLILDSCDATTLVGLRDRALIGVMVYSFARVGAVVAMRVEDYFQNGKRWWMRLHEKGGKRHEVPCHHNAEAYLDLYLTAANLGNDKRAWLFQSVGRNRLPSGSAMHRTDVLRMVKRRARDAGLPDSTCCHTFRATGITAYLDNGGTIENAQAIAAHESPRTTKLYDRTSDEITLDEIERILI